MRLCGKTFDVVVEESFLKFLRTAKILKREFPAGSRELQLQSPTLLRNFCRSIRRSLCYHRGFRFRLRMTVWPRDAPFATARAVEAAEDHDMSAWIFAIALACGIWYFLILVVQAIGFTQLSVKRQSLGEIILLICC